ncbi:hypothetical protein AYO44_17075 [Planctomycetaceae bacterium SCGC AG-212-F19]|nr:hypothetical protein AYO44_17075 [Planctomycetaceae bacterium SCGC AG-212-F19]
MEERALPATDPVLFWNGVALHAAVVDHGIGAPGLQFGPTRTSRAFAIVQGAVFDAVNSIDPEFAPYLIQVSAANDASITAAVAEAAYTTLVSLYPYQKPYFDTQLAASLQGIPLQAEIDGMAVGMTVANTILAARANDGSQVDAAGQPVNYTFGQLPGQWRSDPLHPNAKPLTPDWGGVTPFVVQSAEQFGAPPPPAITSLAYALAYEQVKALGSVNSTVRTDNETDIGFFWGYDAQPGLCAPVRFYNQIAEDVAVKFGNTVVQNARFFAMINFAMADAGITCWDDKYDFNYWRPVTAIRENDPGTGPSGLGSGNPFLTGQGDPTWTPLGAPADNGGGTNFTPPFPSYTSGHASFGAATFKVMEDFYHTDIIPGGITIISDEFNTITVDQNGHVRPLLPRTYNFFSQMAGENAQSRVYLGIHWEFDAAEGIRSGDKIGDYVFTHALTPLHGTRPKALPSLDPYLQIGLSVVLENVAAHGGLRAGHFTGSAVGNSGLVASALLGSSGGEVKAATAPLTAFVGHPLASAPAALEFFQPLAAPQRDGGMGTTGSTSQNPGTSLKTGDGDLMTKLFDSL